MARLNAALDVAAAETVRYLRNGQVVDGGTIRAVAGALSLEQVLHGEATLAGNRCRWSFDPDAIRFDNQPTEPRVGDRIELDIAGEASDWTLEFEVLPADGERCFSAMGSENAEGHRRTFVWTKLVGKRAIV